MKTESKNRIVSVLLAIICGFISGNLFLRLYGIVFAYLNDLNAFLWIKELPKSFRSTAYWLHCFIFEVLVLTIVIFIIGCIIGTFLKIEKLKATMISFISYLFTKAFYHSQVWNEFTFISSPIIYFFIISIITFLLFWCSFHLGGILRKRIC